MEIRLEPCDLPAAMRGDLVTFFIVPGAPGADVRRYRVRAALLRRSASAAIALVVMAAAMVIHSLTLNPVAAENLALRAENARIQAELKLMREGVAQLSNTVDQVARVDQKLRAGARLTTRPPRLPMGPTGDSGELQSGGTIEPLDPLPLQGEALLLTAKALAARAEQTEGSLQALEAYFREQRSVLAATPSVWPIHAVVTSDFGKRSDPFTFEPWAHAGLDLGAPVGTPVMAPAAGVVVFAALEGGYGNVVVVDHGHGIKTRYGHLSSFSVKPGDKVRRGQQIASVGTTGRSTGPHLHYEVRVDGVAQNPRNFILDE